MKVIIKTSLGDITVRLYDETPLHRDNFVKLAREGYYDGTLFHRVIKDFMIQGGDPDSKGALVVLTIPSRQKSSLLCSTSVELWQQHAKATRLTQNVAVAVHNSISFGVRYTTKVR